MKEQGESQAQMMCLRDWFWYDSRGQVLLQQETEVIKRSLTRIAPNDFRLMQVGPVDLSLTCSYLMFFSCMFL